MPTPPMLIVFAGLPGTGKTTLARALARQLRATWLRIDTIEQAVAGHHLPGTAGYDIAVALAVLNLRLGATVVADTVNAVEPARQAWRDAARDAGAALLEIGVVCTDAAEHRRRIEARASDIQGLVLPTWHDVQQRHFEAWTSPHFTIDTAHTQPDAALASILARLESVPPR